jgi:GAF domain-containing protein
MADEIASEKKEKKFDEQTLARVLEAAFVLQEHQRELHELGLRVEPKARVEEPAQAAVSRRTASPEPEIPAKEEYPSVLAQIVEIQQQIQVRHLALEAALSLIVARVIEIKKAAGAAIGILDGKNVRYRAAAGLPALPVGTEVGLEKALCSACLRAGEVIRCPDVNPGFRIDAAECRRRGIQALISVPIYHAGKVAGGLEVYYPNTQAFSESDVHTCQLMAGLVTEALARNQELTLKSSIANERELMREALEKLKPNLAALVDSTVSNVPGTPVAAAKPPLAAGPAKAPPSPAFRCNKCGHVLVGEEQFCGECGTPRSGNYHPSSLQTKVASMFYMQEAAQKNKNGSAAKEASATSAPSPSDHGSRSEPRLDHDVESDLLEPFLPKVPLEVAGVETEKIEAADHQYRVVAGSTEVAAKSHLTITSEINAHDQEVKGEPPEETALAKPDPSANWRSAAAAREFLERVGADQRSEGFVQFLTSHRGDLYLALAVILVAAAIGWGIWSDPSVGATGSSTAAAAHRRADADLSMFDRLLIKLGLAEAPDAPLDKGNPDVQVWIDLHTALYYCPGSDLYGKTPTGKFATQRAAQLDQFEPANRKVCN